MLTEKRKKSNIKILLATSLSNKFMKSKGHKMLTEKRKKSNIKILLATGAIIALLPILAHAKQGVYIVEPFTCEVALADYKHLTKTTKENNPPFVQKQLEISLRATIEELAEHAECEVK